MSDEVLIPTKTQLENCLSMGWEYIGDGLFSKGGMMGYFTPRGWQKD